MRHSSSSSASFSFPALPLPLRSRTGLLWGEAGGDLTREPEALGLAGVAGLSVESMGGGIAGVRPEGRRRRSRIRLP